MPDASEPACRARHREAQYQAIFETSGDYSDEPDPAEVAEDLRRVRAEVAAERRARATTDE